MVTSLFYDTIVHGLAKFSPKGPDIFRLCCLYMVYVSYSSLFILQLVKKIKTILSVQAIRTDHWQDLALQVILCLEPLLIMVG